MPDPAAALVREVFARFGRAFYESNCLERQIVAVLLHIEWRANLKPPMTRKQFKEDYDRFYGALQGMPMGRLVARAKALSGLPEDIRISLDQCLAARNNLAHHYYWDRSGDFAIVEGQRRMLEECDGYCALFEQTDAALVHFLRPWLARHGLTDEAIEDERQRLVDEAAARARQSDYADVCRGFHSANSQHQPVKRRMERQVTIRMPEADPQWREITKVEIDLLYLLRSPKYDDDDRQHFSASVNAGLGELVERFMGPTIHDAGKVEVKMRFPAVAVEEEFLISIGSQRDSTWGYTVAMKATPYNEPFVEAWLPRVNAVVAGILGVAQDIFDGDPGEHMTIRILGEP